MSVTGTTRSVASDDWIVNGTRTGFATTPTVGQSRLTSSRSGSFVWLPTGTTKTGTCASRSRWAASSGGGPSFQSPSLASTTARSPA